MLDSVRNYKNVVDGKVGGIISRKIVSRSNGWSEILTQKIIRFSVTVMEQS